MKTGNNENPRGITPLTAAAVLAALVFLAGCNRSNADGKAIATVEGRPVKVMTVTRTDARAIRSFPGIVKAEREIDLAFRVGGPLVEYDLRIGQSVKKGETLAKIDPRDFEIRLRKLTAKLKAAEARLADAEKDFERQKNLLVENAASQAQYDKTQVLVETTRADIESIAADLTDAKNALEDTCLRAPFDAVVNRKFTENHETVAPGVPVVSLLDVSAIEVATSVPEDILIRKADIAEIYATLDAYPDRKIGAVLKEIGQQTDTANQSYPMTAVLKPPRTIALAPGMAASVHLLLRSPDRSTEGFYLPTAAVFAGADGSSCVWRVAPDSLDTEKVKIETGALKGDEIQVTSGLEPGDQVISAGARFLIEGQKIRILDGDGGSIS